MMHSTKNVSICLTLNTTSQSLEMEECDLNNVNQRWNWGEKNISATWETFGVDLTTLIVKTISSYTFICLYISNIF